MRRSSALALVAVGAILTLAVTIRLPFLNLQVAGVVLVATGLIGMHPPKRVPGRLRRWLELLTPLLELPDDQVARIRVPLEALLRSRHEPAGGEKQPAAGS